MNSSPRGIPRDVVRLLVTRLCTSSASALALQEPRGYYYLGLAYRQQRQEPAALAAFEKALALDPNLSDVLSQIATLYLAKGQAPDDPSIADTLGWILYKKGIYLKAIGLFKESIAKQPDAPVFHHHLGMAYYKNGDLALAKQTLSRALQLSQDFAGAREARDVLASLQ